jgi:LytR cell envelope-related transcriptional attenuator
MGSAPLRLAVIVAAVLVGVLVLAKGFETTAAGVPSRTPTTPGPSPSASQTPTPVHSSPGGGGGPTPKQEGVVVAVYNATSTNGLAHKTATALTHAGYAVPVEGNYGTSAVTSVIYYRSGSDQGKADAGLLRRKFVKGASVQAITDAQVQQLASSTGEKLGQDVELILVLGTDYASTHG